jgi:hypothetical protein
MLPTVGAETPRIVRYSGEVGGRILGVAAMKNLVPDDTRRAALETAGNIILSAAQQLNANYVARITAESFDQRIALGKGRGIDRGFDAIVSIISETVRTGLPDRTTKNPDYRAVFPHGAEEFTSPTIREDEQIAVDLRKAVSDSNLTTKADVVALLDTVIPVVGPAAVALKNSETHLNVLFQTELAGRKLVVDTLWEQRKVVEQALGRAGKGVARFIFFDFHKSSDNTDPETSPTPEPGDGT